LRHPFKRQWDILASGSQTPPASDSETPSCKTLRHPLIRQSDTLASDNEAPSHQTVRHPRSKISKQPSDSFLFLDNLLSDAFLSDTVVRHPLIQTIRLPLMQTVRHPLVRQWDTLSSDSKTPFI
jgi:hypothetical protein